MLQDRSPFEASPASYISMLETSNEETRRRETPVKKNLLDAALDRSKEELERKRFLII